MKDIAIYGSGGFGREVACLITKINEVKPTWNLIGFFDDVKEKGAKNEYGVVLGNLNDVSKWDKELNIIFAIGNPNVVKNIVNKINNPLLKYPNIIAPNTIFLDEDNIKMGQGNIICYGCLFSCNVNIGDFNIFNGFITVGHDTIIGNYNTIMPATRISGNVRVEDTNFLGVSSVILQRVKIGNNTTVGANSTIIKKTKDGETYMGNPAIIIKY